LINQFKSREFIAFLITGGIAAGVNFFSRMIYSVWLDFSFAIILAYITGMITAFVLAKIFVFKSTSQKLHHSVLLFILVNIIAVTQTWLISMGLFYYLLPMVDINQFSREISHAIGVAVPVFTSYIGHKHLSFKN
jgi:putative flippase GtrA